MVRVFSLLGAAALVGTAACASYPAPVQRLADAEAAARSAQDNGATTDPQGQLHLKLAQEGIAQAKGLMANGDNERADHVLIRAKSDAELALGEAREVQTRAEAQKAMDRVAKMQEGLSASSATTTTTSAVTSAPVAPGAGQSTTTSTTTTVQGVKP